MKIMLARRVWLFSVIFGFLLSHGTAYAHQSGCHRWHTCPSDTGSYEMDYTPSTESSGNSPSYSTQPSCPSGQHFDYNSNQCSCSSGMEPDTNGVCGCRAGFAIAPGGSYCLRLPAHAEGNANDADGWSCDGGYLKQGISCVHVVSSSSSSSASSKVKAVQAVTTSCSVNGALPDTSCTPGAVFQDATKDKICVSGYTKTVRNVSVSTKNKVFAEYGVMAHNGGTYEVDHLIPLELGGSNDVKNLWPEAAAEPINFHTKDKLENKLHSMVCNGSISLQDVQKEISMDWLKTYNFIFSNASH